MSLSVHNSKLNINQTQVIVEIGQDSTVDDNAFKERKLEVYFQSKTLGKLWLGQGDTASNGTSEKDLSGTSVASYSETGAIGRRLSYRDANTQEAIGTIGSYISNFDGLSRRDRIRYDTPKLGGLMLSASAAQGDLFDVALHYGGEVAGFKVKAGLAYADGGDSYDSQVNGSFSVLHDSGFNVTLAAGGRDLGDGVDRDPLFYYGKLGYKANFLPMGSTAFSIDYGYGEEINSNKEAEGTVYGVSLVQKIKKASTELFVNFENNELDAPGVDAEDIFIVTGGARVKF